MLIYCIVTLGLNVQLGYAGISNFGVAGFLLLGAYTAAVVAAPPSHSEYMTYVGGFGSALNLLPGLATDQWLPYAIGLFAAGIVCGAMAAVLALFTTRLSGDFLAIATIGAAELLRAVTTAEIWLVNGDRGLIGFGMPFANVFGREDYAYVFALMLAVAVVIIYLISERALRSPWGRVLRAVRGDSLAAEAFGKDVFKFRLQALVFGGVVTGIGGGLYAYLLQGLTPSNFDPLQGTFLFWVMLIIGGTGNNRGALFGAYIVWGFWIASAQVAALPLPVEISSRIPFVRYMLLGIFFIVALLLRPQGLFPEERRVSRWLGPSLAKPVDTSRP
jgi:branched-chain amino acid transport system permease protein